jgi:hypothetical protein
MDELSAMRRRVHALVGSEIDATELSFMASLFSATLSLGLTTVQQDSATDAPLRSEAAFQTII